MGNIKDRLSSVETYSAWLGYIGTGFEPGAGSDNDNELELFDIAVWCFVWRRFNFLLLGLKIK